MKEKIEAKVTQLCRASAERVFDAWLTPDMVRIWMAAALRSMGLPGDIRRVEIDPSPGGRFLFYDQRPGMEARHWGTYLEIDRPRKLVFTWITDSSEEADPSIVTLTLTPDGEGCIATIVHEMSAEWADYVKRTEDGWTRMLTHIDAMLS